MNHWDDSRNLLSRNFWNRPLAWLLMNCGQEFFGPRLSSDRRRQFHTLSHHSLERFRWKLCKKNKPKCVYACHLLLSNQYPKSTTGNYKNHEMIWYADCKTPCMLWTNACNTFSIVMKTWTKFFPFPHPGYWWRKNHRQDQDADDRHRPRELRPWSKSERRTRETIPVGHSHGHGVRDFRVVLLKKVPFSNKQRWENWSQPSIPEPGYGSWPPTATQWLSDARVLPHTYGMTAAWGSASPSTYWSTVACALLNYVWQWSSLRVCLHIAGTIMTLCIKSEILVHKNIRQ